MCQTGSWAVLSCHRTEPLQLNEVINHLKRGMTGTEDSSSAFPAGKWSMGSRSGLLQGFAEVEGEENMIFDHFWFLQKLG